MIEPEVLMSNFSYLSYNAMSWGYWTPGAREDVGSPKVAMYKAVTKGLHLTHLTERWAQHHEDGIQQAFFSGIGFESWENVWGIWNGITERDAEAVRRTSSILRQFEYLVQGADWTPHVVLSDFANLVYASQFRSEERQETLWILVNRDNYEAFTEVVLPCNTEQSVILDVYNGLILGLQHKVKTLEINHLNVVFS